VRRLSSPKLGSQKTYQTPRTRGPREGRTLRKCFGRLPAEISGQFPDGVLLLPSAESDSGYGIVT
jgi:hypothetical protein